MQNKTKVRVSCVYYTWHPDFIDHGNGVYDTLETGRWVVEWNVKIGGDRWRFQHFTADCATETMAKKLVYLLNKKHDRLHPWAEVDQDDLCLKSGVFVNVGRGGDIIAKTVAATTTKQKQA